MKIRYLGSNSTACDLYRAGLPFKTLNEKGHDVEMVHKDLQYAYDKNTGEILGTNIECDVLIVPRPVTEVQYNVLIGAKRQGAAVVVEVDDEITDVHTDNHAYEYINSGLDWFNKSLEEAHLITVSTDRLHEIYHPDKSVVIPNYIPDVVFESPPGQDKKGIGWTGSIKVHPNDLQQVGDSIKRMRKKHGWVFKHIGDGNLSKIIKTNYISYGYVPYDQYLLGIDTFAIGIVPLEQSNFNDSKSWLKGLEMASLGVPFVASPTREYRKLSLKYGLGELANSPYEWYVEMRRLTDDEYRKEQSENYRHVAETFSISRNDWRWLEAWEEAIERKRNG